jgi:hypothetical protein
VVATAALPVGGEQKRGEDRRDELILGVMGQQALFDVQHDALTR